MELHHLRGEERHGIPGERRMRQGRHAASGLKSRGVSSVGKRVILCAGKLCLAGTRRGSRFIWFRNSRFFLSTLDESRASFQTGINSVRIFQFYLKSRHVRNDLSGGWAYNRPQGRRFLARAERAHIQAWHQRAEARISTATAKSCGADRGTASATAGPAFFRVTP